MNDRQPIRVTRDLIKSLEPGGHMALNPARQGSRGRWLILRPTGGARRQGATRPEGTTHPATRKVVSAALLGAWTGIGVTTAFLMPLALGAHIPTAFAAGIMGALLPRALLAGLVFATAAFLLMLRVGGPSRTLAAVSALSAAGARNLLIPRADAALASGLGGPFAWLHLLSILVFSLSVLAAAAAVAILAAPAWPLGRGPGRHLWLR